MQPTEYLVRVTPRSSQSAVVEQRGNFLKVKLHAPPAEGRANRELIELLAEYFAVSKSEVEILKGLTGRDKLVKIG